MSREREGLRTPTDLCADCGHAMMYHGFGTLLPSGCIASVDKRHVTAGGPLSPCDCKGFAPAAALPGTGTRATE